ncbi:MAG: 16S rRNA (uracil1498-N3)-methyltransferase [Chlamydiales bacterium]|jgi:16S rRNA (uracil1498-N3)-methyltransferase
MPVNRYFIEENLKKESYVKLEGQELHHLLHVMRASAGDCIELVNGKGELALARVESVAKRNATIQVEEISFQEKPAFEVIVAQAIPRANRMDTILEKGTELGMSQIWLFAGDLSEKKSLGNQREHRLKAVTISAMKQCGRLYLPDIVMMPPLCSWQKLTYPAFFGDIEPEAPTFVRKWEELQPSTGVIFFVGPESGLTPKEVKWLREADVHGVKLHENILRTDTAPLVALSLIQHWRMS